jgi:hypothetical protein
LEFVVAATGQHAADEQGKKQLRPAGNRGQAHGWHPLQLLNGQKYTLIAFNAFVSRVQVDAVQ